MDDTFVNTFVRTLSINVANCSVTLVGLLIRGIKISIYDIKKIGFDLISIMIQKIYVLICQVTYLFFLYISIY